MADKWRFDPNMDYSHDYEDNGDNYQRFRAKGKKNRDGGDSYSNNKKKDRRHTRSESWR